LGRHQTHQLTDVPRDKLTVTRTTSGPQREWRCLTLVDIDTTETRPVHGLLGLDYLDTMQMRCVQELLGQDLMSTQSTVAFFVMILSTSVQQQFPKRQ